LFNRTDCCGERLRGFWLLVSNDPFTEGETADQARARTGVWGLYQLSAGPKLTVKTPGVSGRYVRIQFDGQSVPGGRFLSVAELQVLQGAAPAPTAKPAAPSVQRFSTNKANIFEIDVDAPGGAKVTYELWPQASLRFMVDGKRVLPLRQEGAAVLPLGPGRHKVVVRYQSLVHTSFWIFYLSFLTVCAGTTGWWAYRRLRRRDIAT